MRDGSPHLGQAVSDSIYSEEARQAFLWRSYAQDYDIYRSVLDPALFKDMSEDAALGIHLRAIESLTEVLESPATPARKAKLAALVKELTADPDERKAGITAQLLMQQYVPAIEAHLATRAELTQQGETMLAGYLDNLTRTRSDMAISTLPEQKPADVQSFINTHYSNGGAQGVGVEMGSYGVAVSRGGKASTDFIATDYLKDCVCLVLVGRSPTDPTATTALLAHIDVTTDLTTEIPRLLAEMPPGYRIEATLAGSKDNDNPYMNAEIVHQLADSGRVQQLRYNFNGPSIVAVHVPTGTVLTSSIHETEDMAYSIGTDVFPVKLNFVDPQQFGSYRDLDWELLKDRSASTPFLPTSTMTRVLDPMAPAEKEASPAALFKQLSADGVISSDDLHQLVFTIGQALHRGDVRYELSEERDTIKIFAGDSSVAAFYAVNAKVGADVPQKGR